MKLNKTTWSLSSQGSSWGESSTVPPSSGSRVRPGGVGGGCPARGAALGQVTPRSFVHSANTDSIGARLLRTWRISQDRQGAPVLGWRWRWGVGGKRAGKVPTWDRGVVTAETRQGGWAKQGPRNQVNEDGLSPNAKGALGVMEGTARSYRPSGKTIWRQHGNGLKGSTAEAGRRAGRWLKVPRWPGLVTVEGKIGDVWESITGSPCVMPTVGQTEEKNASSMSPAFCIGKRADSGLSLRYRPVRHRR